jgi:hypothetical protein
MVFFVEDTKYKSVACKISIFSLPFISFPFLCLILNKYWYVLEQIKEATFALGLMCAVLYYFELNLLLLMVTVDLVL